MPEDRRTFLKYLGALGAAGVALPGSALAFGRRRAPVVCPPVCPPADALIRPVPYVNIASFHISYPHPAGADAANATPIRGRGGFCTWGTYDTTASPPIYNVNRAWVYSETGQLLGDPVEWVPQSWIENNRWGFAFGNIPVDTPFEIRYQIMRWVNNPWPMLEPIIHTYRWFKCVNDHPF